MDVIPKKKKRHLLKPKKAGNLIVTYREQLRTARIPIGRQKMKQLFKKKHGKKNLKHYEFFIDLMVSNLILSKKLTIANKELKCLKNK